eukprot:TRINITY_DN8757_c0_g1_i2.p1 TRINITY_DN8757_c0_g1~~TRINITY_DN8757_c0_g1_i2.p1  ORF type:complete len:198 (+),score=50.29 TRINITY_DN8757_c0_g1_i2:317-910(+)
MKDEESFVYLAAMQGIATIAGEFPQKALPQFQEVFRDTSVALEVRLRIGEVFVECATILNEMLSVYGYIWVDTFLWVLSRPDEYEEELRGSAMANLGTFARVNRLAANKHLTHILYACKAVLRNDPSVVVRRGALVFLQDLLSGLGTSVLTVMGDEISEVYNLLKYTAENDDDTIVRHHASLGLGVLDESMREYLFG